ncbi:MAG: hypothetical protein NC335_07815 [Bacteroides sp.]|nr:hypothetical protein [Bacteroides sp.]
MMTREEILSLEEYCAEHGLSHKKRLEELGIPFWNFYRARQKYRKADGQEAYPGQFILLSPVRHVPQTMPPARTAVKPATPTEEKSGSYLTIELQTRTGTAMRIQGVLTPAHLSELIAAGNVQP